MQIQFFVQPEFLIVDVLNEHDENLRTSKFCLQYLS
jgi:hypothetical protein